MNPEKALQIIERAEQILDSMTAKLPEAKSQFEYLKEKKKTVIAFEMRIAEGKGFKSVSAQEREAYASKAYQDWLDDFLRASIDYETVRMEYETAKTKIDVWRTTQSTLRAQMQLV